MKVQFIDLQQRFEEEREELIACFQKTLSQGSLVMGNSLQEFEDEIQKFTGASHCVGLNSGTDALMMSLWSCGIKKGDEVIHPAISFIATTAAIVHVGAKPVFAEVKYDGLIDPEKLLEKITPKTKAVMPVHWSGKICEINKIKKICDDHNLILIEDAAQAMGAFYNGQHGGRFSQAAAFSCHPLKNFNAVGDGGFLITDNEEIASKVRLYRNHGIQSRDNVTIFGINSRLDALNAEILKFRLKRLDSIIERRAKNANLYRHFIDSKFVTLPIEQKEAGYKDAYVLFLAHVERRDELKKFLDQAGVESMVYYGTPLHLHKASAVLGHKKGDFPVAEHLCKKVLALPINQHLNQVQIEYACEMINKFYKSS